MNPTTVSKLFSKEPPGKVCYSSLNLKRWETELLLQQHPNLRKPPTDIPGEAGKRY